MNGNPHEIKVTSRKDPLAVLHNPLLYRFLSERQKACAADREVADLDVMLAELEDEVEGLGAELDEAVGLLRRTFFIWGHYAPDLTLMKQVGVFLEKYETPAPTSDGGA